MADEGLERVVWGLKKKVYDDHDKRIADLETNRAACAHIHKGIEGMVKTIERINEKQIRMEVWQRGVDKAIFETAASLRAIEKSLQDKATASSLKAIEEVLQGKEVDEAREDGEEAGVRQAIHQLYKRLAVIIPISIAGGGLLLQLLQFLWETRTVTP